MSARNIAGTIILVLTVLFGLAPLVRGTLELPVPQHHLLHSALILGAIASALCFATPSRDTTGGRYGWLVLTIVSPLIAMLLMWPSEYAWFERHPGGHAVEHIGLIVFAFVAAYAGQRYIAGVGWASALSLLFMAIGSVWGFGIAPVSMTAAAPQSGVATAVSDASTVPGSPSVTHGRALFTQNCAACHGAQGAGGAGPSLKNEKSRKDLAQAQQWIMNPAPPMPKLYPSTLTRADVRDIAAYVETL